jgi:EAL domain-containing protein (putative c-di-GMP-specific phosphodiesterase class I)
MSIVEVTRRALAETGFPAHRLELEITEGVFLQSSPHVIAQLRGLKDLGVQIALDDFGVGYCSLGYLGRFPIDKLKIDKSFLSDAISRPKQIVPILETIARLGRTLGLTVVAEGIETIEQAELAERIGCQQLQGFYFCTPLEETDVAAFVLCNQMGTSSLLDTAATGTDGQPTSFWSKLIWTETSGTWAPGNLKTV